MNASPTITGDAWWRVLEFIGWNADDLRKHDPLVTIHKPSPKRLRRPPSLHVDPSGFRVYSTDGLSLADFDRCWTDRALDHIDRPDTSWHRRLDLAGAA